MQTAPDPPARLQQVRNKWAWLAVTVISAFAIRFAVALALPNIERADEIFQNLEPAFRMWSGGGVTTWEWREGIRSPLFPGFLAALIGISEWFGLGPAGYLTVISGVLSLLASGSVAVGFLLGWRQARAGGGIVCGLLCAIWTDMIYFGPKPLAEVQAGNLLIIAAYLTIPAPDQAAWRRLTARQFAGGLLLGFTFCVRFQLAAAILVVALWGCRSNFRRCWLPMLAGAIVPVALMGVIDLFSWGSLFHSVVRNWQLNISEHVSKEFGVEPAYYYVDTLATEWGAAGVLIVITAVLGLRLAPLLGAVAAAVIVSHSAVAHKEISFVYAALAPILILAGLGTTSLVGWSTRRLAPAGGVMAVGAVVALWGTVSFSTAMSPEFLWRWQAHAGVLRAEETMRNDPELCGLGVRWPDLRWFWTGGDVYLGRPVPIYAFGTAAGIARVAPAINYAIGGTSVAAGMPGFSVVRCWGKEGDVICMARADRRSTCIRNPGLDLNSLPNLGRLHTEHGADPP